MTAGKTRTLDSIQWLPAERLGQVTVDAHVRPWLIGKGLLTLRMKAVCGERFDLQLVDQWTGLLNDAHKSTLRSPDNAGLFRDVEMCCGERVWVFAQTIMPDSTLCPPPCLPELADSAFLPTLITLSA